MNNSKGIRVAGGVMRNGALFTNGHNAHLDPRRENRSAAPGLFRLDGAPKRLTDPAPAHGQKRRTKGALSAYHHGVTVQDEPMTTKPGHTGKAVPIHNGMGSATPEHRGANYGPDHGSKILGSAGPASWRDEPHGGARLPAKGR